MEMNDLNKINESNEDKIILKPQKPRSLANCIVGGISYELAIDALQNVYIYIINNNDIVSECEDRNNTIIIPPKNCVKYFRHISFILLTFYKNLFKIGDDKEIDKINFYVIKDYLGKDYEYGYLVKVMMGYSVNDYFMKINDKPLIRYIFKSPERMYEFHNYYERHVIKKLSPSVNKDKSSQQMIICCRYSPNHQDDKISFCRKEVNIWSPCKTYNGLILCEWHYSENIAISNPYSYSRESLYIKRMLIHNNSVDKYIESIYQEYGKNNDVINKWINFLLKEDDK